ncbi:binding-protein-dependent transport systems inner membrane component [[Clostridium] cellulosi]|uniref:Binding-protein-dependent transport systems inner membrane component n=1 Tax=[Clostridium] cellulosi TaxID=29343 RepID=A0A078KLX3_9FIRM|nr:binding-protein-dependent transport systems inner membrane component [[Clostridium] cellulosi]
MESAPAKSKHVKLSHINRISPASNAIINIIFLIILFLFIMPVILIIMVSFSSNDSILQNGYSYWPSEFSLEAYRFVFKYWKDIGRAYGVSLFVTAFGSVAATLIIALYAYPLSRSSFGPRNKFAFFAFFTTIFGGGLVPWVIVYSRVFQIDSTVWILIVPYLLNAWWVIIMRTFMKSSVPDDLIEAARIDGAGEFRIFFTIVLPLARAGLATIFLFCLLRFWNDYYLSLIFIKDSHLYTIQYYMYQLLNNITYLTTNTNVPPTARQNLPSDSIRMAIAVIAVGPVIFCYGFFQRYFVKGIIVGAVKG